MKRQLSYLILGTLLTVSLASAQDAKKSDKPIEPEKLNLGRPVSFVDDIQDILDINCIACHNEAIRESKLSLESAEDMLKGGKRGPSIVPGKPDESLFYLVASRQKTPHMPPLPNKVEATALTPRELGLVRTWIAEGAKGAADTGGITVNWQPIPAGMNAIYDVALSPWGERVAAGRANQILVYNVHSGEEVRLIDPSLNDLQFNDQKMYPDGAAHRDFVHALAFHPQQRMLASAGFRVVKLWQQPVDVQARKFGLGADPSASAAHPGSGLIATGTKQNQIQIHNSADGKLTKTLSGHTAAVTGVAFSADGKHVVSGSEDKTVRVWSIETGETIRQITTPAVVTDVLLRIDGMQIVSAHADNKVRVWSLTAPADEIPEAGEKPVREIAHTGVTCLCTTPTATQILSGGTDNNARIWNLDSGAAVRALNHGGPVISVACRADGQAFLTGSTNNTAKLWDAAGKQIAELRGHVPTRRAEAIAVETQELAKQLVALADAAQKAADKNAKERADAFKKSEEAKKKAGEEVVKAKKAFDDAKQKADDAKAAALKVVTDATEAQKTAQTAFEAAKQKLTDAQAAEKTAVQAKTTADKTVTEATAAVDQSQKNLDAARKAADADKDSQDLAKAVTAAETAKKTADEKLAADTVIQTAAAKTQTDSQAAAKAATTASAAAEKANTAALAKVKTATDAKTKADAAADKTLTKPTDDLKKQEEAQKSAVRSVELARKADAKAKVDLESSRKKHEGTQAHQKTMEEATKKAQEATKTSEKPITAVAFSTNGKRIATSTDDGTIQIWDAAKGQPIDTLSGTGGPVRSLTFLDSRFLLSIGDGQDAIVWDANPDWTLVARLGAGEDPLTVKGSPFEFRVLSLAFSPDGTLLATGGGDPSRSGELHLWDVTKQVLVRTVEDAHSDTIFGLQFSKDGSKIVSGAADKFVKVHEVKTGKHVKSFEGHTHHVLDVSWKADGSQLVSAGADNAIKVWNVETGEQIRTITNYQKQVTSIHFVGLSGNCISCGGDKTVRYHTAANGSNIRSFSGGTDFMYSADATRDQAIVVAAGEDGVVRIWNGANGQVLQSFAPPVADDAQASAAK
ncbi:MAG: c-type cytochrome domain-containing protein [Planctomycetaceae bacterium]